MSPDRPRTHLPDGMPIAGTQGDGPTPRRAPLVVEAVVFDLDGVLLDSEQVWDEVRREYVLDRGGRWPQQAHQDMMGMSSAEWSAYIADDLLVPGSAATINEDVVRLMIERYRTEVPTLPGAVDTVMGMAANWPLGLASSSNRPIIDLVLRQAGLARLFAVTVSSEEVARGKPAPDVYLEAAEQLGVESDRAAAVEDSANGIWSAKAAGMRVVAIPNPHYPPAAAALADADVVLASLDELTPQVVDPAGGHERP